MGLIPFGSDANPYQELTRRALASAGLDVRPIPKSNWMPLLRAARSGLDVLHLDWPHSFYRGRNAVLSGIKRSMFRWQLPRLGGVKVVWTVHNLETHNTGGSGDGELARLVDRADALVSLSETGVAGIRERWPEARHKPIAVIPHGHYVDWYDTGGSRIEARAFLGIPAGAVVGVLAGRLQPYKGIESLVQAFREVAREEDWLLLAGAPLNAEYARELQTMAACHPRIVLRDAFLSKEELEQVLAAGDFAAFPFQAIFNSGSVILAMSFGLPVLATAKGSIPEVVPERSWFDAGDGSQPELVNALRGAFRAPDLVERGRVARKQVLARHSWQVVGTRLADLYRQLCAQRQEV